MEFRTIVRCEKLLHLISHRDEILLLGSCFAENIGRLLLSHKFNVGINPTGILYNPVSIADVLVLLMDGCEFTSGDLFRSGNLWHSFGHHSRFSHTDREQCVRDINGELRLGAERLARASWLFVTFGTSYVYRLHETGHVVANCHKQPASMFDRRRGSAEEFVGCWMSLIDRLLSVNPEINIMFSVSPIRHLKDGAHENQLSKSVLLLLTDELCRAYPERCNYFPSYEIVMDELRDYRFYDAGMTHLSEQAVGYIWERFSDSCFSDDTRNLNREWERLEKALLHRPLTPDGETYRNFLVQNLFKLKKIQEKYSYFDVSKEIESLELLLKTPWSDEL